MASSNDYSNTQNCFRSRLRACLPNQCVQESLVHSPCLSATAAPLHLMNSCLLLRRALFLYFRNQMSSYHCSILVDQKVTFDSRSVISVLCAFLTSFCSSQWSSWLVCDLELLLQLHLDLQSLKQCFYAHSHHAFYETLIHPDYHCFADLTIQKLSVLDSKGVSLQLNGQQATSYSSACRW